MQNRVQGGAYSEELKALTGGRSACTIVLATPEAKSPNTCYGNKLINTRTNLLLADGHHKACRAVEPGVLAAILGVKNAPLNGVSTAVHPFGKFGIENVRKPQVHPSSELDPALRNATHEEIAGISMNAKPFQ